jgi:hypothetical protein
MVNQYYKTQSPILFIIFNRLDTSLKVFEQIKLTQPARLYITADGPRKARQGEDIMCAKVKAAILAGINWECEVKTLFREENLGPKNAISSAVDWFFETEEEGIILEHDCLPDNSFFKYCDVLLDKYRLDTRIFLIAGSNHLRGKKWGEASYYFSNLTNAWGWAIWKRSWNLYDKDLKQIDEKDVKEILTKIFDDPFIIECWLKIFIKTKAGEIDTWDYQLTFAHFINNGLNVIPNNNLVSNIGFGAGAENTTDADSVFAAIPLEPLGDMVYPKYMLPEKVADDLILKEEFKSTIHFLKKEMLFRRRFKRKLKALFNNMVNR